MTDSGEVRTVEVSPSFGVRILDRALTGKVERYLDIVSAVRESDLRRMTVSTAGTGERDLFIGYISEVPVWKTTYRLVLSSKRKPLIQGWAIVDNAVGEDWERMDLSLGPEFRCGTRVANVLARTSTGADGRYEIRSLPEGQAEVLIQSMGLSQTTVSGLVLVAGARTDASASLQVGSVAQTVDVSASLVGNQLGLPQAGAGIRPAARSLPTEPSDQVPLLCEPRVAVAA